MGDPRDENTGILIGSVEYYITNAPCPKKANKSPFTSQIGDLINGLTQ